MAFTGKIYFRIVDLDLGSVALALHVSGLGLDTYGLVNIPGRNITTTTKSKSNSTRKTFK